MSQHYVYILECSNGTLYTGYTTDVERRYQEHCQGSPKCKYTRSFPPKRLCAYWLVDGGKTAAMQLEYQIKRLSRAKKLALIADYEKENA